jgi:hypothetical protein
MGQEEVSRNVAEYLLSVRSDDRGAGRMNELSELAQRGELTMEDQDEPVSYINVGNFISTL